MAKIFITLCVEAKDKLTATAIIKDKIDDSCCDIVAISTDNPYENEIIN